MERQVAVDSTAEAYLELLAARGIDYLFGNAGTDFGPLIDAYAKRIATEQPVPAPVTRAIFSHAAMRLFPYICVLSVVAWTVTRPAIS